MANHPSAEKRNRQRIKRKLNLATGSQLVQYAVNWFSGREAGTA